MTDKKKRKYDIIERGVKQPPNPPPPPKGVSEPPRPPHTHTEPNLPPGISQERLDELVAEAERGYDVDKLKARRTVHPTWQTALGLLQIFDPDGLAHILGDTTDSMDYTECGKEFSTTAGWNEIVGHTAVVCARCVGEILRRQLWDA